MSGAAGGTWQRPPTRLARLASQAPPGAHHQAGLGAPGCLGAGGRASPGMQGTFGDVVIRRKAARKPGTFSIPCESSLEGGGKRGGGHLSYLALPQKAGAGRDPQP